MLGFFPNFYEDEMLYSVFARYHVRSGNTVIKDTVNDLFGNKSAYATADFPTDLGYLYGTVKIFNVPPLKAWIHQQTLFNYYSNFLKQKVREKIYKTMVKQKDNTTLQTLIGLTTSTVKTNPFFQYCPTCATEDMDKYGETYWRMTHQLPSVMICLKHKELLQDSDVLIREKNKHQFIHATKDNCSKQSCSPVYSSKTMEFLLVIAEQSKKLATKQFQFEPKTMELIYHYLLKVKGYQTIKGKTHHEKLTTDFKNYFGEEFLDLMQSNVDFDNAHCWLKGIARIHKKGFHPIRHLLFILFLGETVESILDYQNKTYEPFGMGPYLCLNAACKGYLKPVIKEVTVTRCTDTRLPVGTFECRCGFMYSRRGPDQKPEDKRKIGRIKNFGDIWMKKLEEYIRIEKKSYRETARLLNVDTNTVIKYANHFGAISHSIEEDIEDETEVLNEKFYKQTWRELQIRYPDYSKTELRKSAPAVYTWLYRNKREWLDEHSPTKKKQTPVNNRVDWKERDQEVLNEVKNATKELLAKEKPVRLTVSSIGKEINKLPLLEKKIDKLPKTKKYLQRVTESVDDFQIRRVYWAAKVLEKENLEVKEWMIMRRAGLKPDISERVNNEIEKQVDSIAMKKTHLSI
ncbi:TnsD family transposase [Rossellomorea oryzaecorticis]|uniref:TnsD family transposase n=1 Tax=Rossellomorea oryzaecorticis TaxID=1396505 RepID=A0ABW8VUF9_9BACI